MPKAYLVGVNEEGNVSIRKLNKIPDDVTIASLTEEGEEVTVETSLKSLRGALVSLGCDKEDINVAIKSAKTESGWVSVDQY